MNTQRFLAITSGLAACWAIPGYAIEAPADDAPPPAAQAPALPNPGRLLGAQPNQAIAPKAEAGYLGVVCSEVPDMLASHLNLNAGQGIVVRAVMPDAPAANAGVAIFDVITRLDGQPVGSSLDLTKQVSSHHPGDKLQLDLIRHGKPTTVDVTLGVRPHEMAGMNQIPLDNLKLDGIPQELAERVRDAIQGNLGGLNLDEMQNDPAAPPQVGQAMRDMQQRMQQAMGALKLPQVPGAAIRLMDENGSIELKSNEGGKEVTARDQSGKVTWSGPWDSEPDKAAAPAEVRQRVERLNIDPNFNGNGLRLQLQGNRPGE